MSFQSIHEAPQHKSGWTDSFNFGNSNMLEWVGEQGFSTDSLTSLKKIEPGSFEDSVLSGLQRLELLRQELTPKTFRNPEYMMDILERRLNEIEGSLKKALEEKSTLSQDEIDLALFLIKDLVEIELADEDDSSANGPTIDDLANAN